MRASAARASSVTTTEPTGAPSPFERQTERVSNCAPYDDRGVPVATAAFQMRAPSQCRATPWEDVRVRSASSAASGWTAPPPRLWVCSTLTAWVATVPQPAGRSCAPTSSTVSSPRGAVTVRLEMPPCCAAPPCS